MRKLIIVGLITFVPIWVSAQKAFKNWPEGISPKEVGELVSKRFVEVPHPQFLMAIQLPLMKSLILRHVPGSELYVMRI